MDGEKLAILMSVKPETSQKLKKLMFFHHPVQA